jgi:hypothetical protein
MKKFSVVLTTRGYSEYTVEAVDADAAKALAKEAYIDRDEYQNLHSVQAGNVILDDEGFDGFDAITVEEV